MGSRDVLRLGATRWVSGPAPCLKSPQPRRSASTGTSTNYHGLSNITRSTLRLNQQTQSKVNFIAHRAASTRRFTKTTASRSLPQKRRNHLLYTVAAFALVVPILNELRKATSTDPRATLNKDLFTPCTVLSNEPLSPSAFIITVQLPPRASNSSIIAAAHRHGLWSVEVKQPQIQIARNYTPLPLPLTSPSTSPDGPQQLRFYVRRYDSGEVSTYLSRLGAGDEIEIRGPHLGFDLGGRLGKTAADGSKRKVVFLAGGTGVAPALQAASFLLEREAVDVDVLWANRGAADCAGCPRVGDAAPPQPHQQQQRGWWPFSSSSAKRPDASWKQLDAEEEPSAVTRQLRELQDAYAAKGRKLEVRCAVDAEGSFVRAGDIADAVARADSPLQTQESPDCYLHSQRLLERSTEEADAAGDVLPAKKRSCACAHDGENGKNLFIISGPDGFVGAFAGAKVWADGGERQGPVGGVIAQLMRKDPETWKNWLVLKQ